MKRLGKKHEEKSGVCIGSGTPNQKEKLMGRKLKYEEIAAVSEAAKCIIKMFNWEETRKGNKYWREVYMELLAMMTSGTTDGDPLIEIPEGFRLVEDGDESREDVMVLEEAIGEWVERKSGVYSFSERRLYIVPEDKTPTEEDEAVTRFIMVRNSEYDPWKKRVFVSIERGSRHPYKVADIERLIVEGFQFARHLYPGE